MKRMAFILITLMMTANVVFADDFNVPILTKDEIAHLSDTVLLDTYVDTCVEIEASKTFRATSGFKPDEFKSFKDLLRYRVWLTTEIKKRKLEPPVVE